MTLETVIMLIAFSLFFICTVLFLIRTSASSLFRNKIAAPRSFVEGAQSSVVYPLWALSYGLLFIQCAAFMAFPTSGELALNNRLIAYILSLIIFFVLRAFNLPLLAVWFGKNGIWVSHGAEGIIKFSDMVSCEVIKSKKSRVNDSESLCTVVFYAEGRHQLFHTKRYSFRVVARKLEPYMSKLPISETRTSALSVISSRSALICILSYLCVAIAIFGSVCFLFSSALTSPYTYTENEITTNNEILTFTPITEVLEADDLIILRHNAIEAINVYSEQSGEFLWSISRKKSAFPKSDDGISAAQGVLRYTVNGSDRYFSVSNGTELPFEAVSGITFPSPDQLRDIDFDFNPLYVRKQLSDGSYRYIVNRPGSYILFLPAVSWGILICSLLMLYLLRATANKTTGDATETEEETALPPPLLNAPKEIDNTEHEEIEIEEVPPAPPDSDVITEMLSITPAEPAEKANVDETEYFSPFDDDWDSRPTPDSLSPDRSPSPTPVPSEPTEIAAPKYNEDGEQ